MDGCEPAARASFLAGDLDDVAAQIPQRARLTLWVIAAGSVPFLLAGLLGGVAPRRAAVVICLALWIVTAALLVLLRRRPHPETGRIAALTGIAGVAVAVTAYGVASGDAVAPALVLCPLALAAALAFPWGVAAQALVVVLALSGIGVGLLAVEGSLLALGPAGAAAVLAALLTSLVAARMHVSFLDRLVEQIGARREAETRAERERWFRALVERSSDASLVVRPDGTVLYASAGVGQLLGVNPEALRGRQLHEHVHPEDRPRLRELIAGGTTSGASLIELRAWRSDGRRVWLEVLADDHRDDPAIRGVVLRARDVTQRRRTALQREALLEVARDIAGTLDIQELLDRVQRRVVALLPCDRAAAFYRQEATDTFRMIASYGLPESLLPKARSLDFAEDLPVAQRLRKGLSVVINDPANQEWLCPGLLAEFGIGSLLAVPLLVGERLLGVLNFARVSRDRPFGSDAVRLCEGIARQVAVALASAEAYRRQREAAEVSSALARVGRELIASADTPQVLSRLCQVTAEVLDCHGSRTVLWDDEEGAYRIVASWGDSREEWESARLMRIPRETLSDLIDVLRRRDVLSYLESRDHLEGLLARLPRMSDIRSALHIALRRGHEVIGYQVAYYRGVERRFTRQHLRIAHGISHFGSLALENARLIEELETASRLKIGLCRQHVPRTAQPAQHHSRLPVVDAGGSFRASDRGAARRTRTPRPQRARSSGSGQRDVGSQPPRSAADSSRRRRGGSPSTGRRTRRGDR